MLNKLTPFIDKHFGQHFVPLLKQQVFGLVEDFWADGPNNMLGLDLRPTFLKHLIPAKPAPKPAFVRPAPAKPVIPQGIWHAAPGEVSERMWGQGYVAPCDELMTEKLIKPLGLSRDMSVLDLSAGLGGRMRLINRVTGAFVTGLEPDAGIAARGMEMSVKAGKEKESPIVHYNPDHLSLDRTYDCFIARETFYRVPKRADFFTAMAKHAKPHAQLAFTDFIVEPEHKDNPVILAWKGNEPMTNPVGLVEMSELWAKAGFTLRVHEDLTDMYRTEVMEGLERLMKFLGAGVTPDAETAKAVWRRIETWKHRLAAMGAGMKFYRFYGVKH